MPTGNSQWRSSNMASGKRASMREVPLAALFRKTEEEGLEDRPRSDAPAEGGQGEPRAEGRRKGREPDPQPPRIQELPPRRERPQPEAAERGPRKPVDRLREVFSPDIPENILERGSRSGSEDVRPRYGREEPSASIPAPQEVHEPVLRVVGVGGAGVNAVNRMI